MAELSYYVFHLQYEEGRTYKDFSYSLINSHFTLYSQSLARVSLAYNYIILNNGDEITYSHLILAPSINPRSH